MDEPRVTYSINIQYSVFVYSHLSTAETYLELLSNCALTFTPIAASVIKMLTNAYHWEMTLKFLLIMRHWA